MPSATHIFNGNDLKHDCCPSMPEPISMGKSAGMIEEPYRSALKDILKFSTLDEAEHTIKQLEKICRKYAAASDKKGVEYCRRVGLIGRRRARLISRNPKVAPRKRLEKHEISEWFRIWLETPDLFSDWLEMRKQAEGYKNLF
jgi:hypothetical protein